MSTDAPIGIVVRNGSTMDVVLFMTLSGMVLLAITTWAPARNMSNRLERLSQLKPGILFTQSAPL